MQAEIDAVLGSDLSEALKQAHLAEIRKRYANRSDPSSRRISPDVI